ncbi:replication protein [Salmonella sp. 32070601201500089SM]|nr:replication protein [Salmonella sp. 32070601201500089SM]
MSMSNTAEIYKFPAPVPTQQECRMADLENGYLRLANQIQDALCIVELSGREFRVLNAIIRLTYGWSKKSDRIANSLIADKTALKVKHVSEAVLSLAYRIDEWKKYRVLVNRVDTSNPDWPARRN